METPVAGDPALGDSPSVREGLEKQVDQQRVIVEQYGLLAKYFEAAKQAMESVYAKMATQVDVVVGSELSPEEQKVVNVFVNNAARFTLVPSPEASFSAMKSVELSIMAKGWLQSSQTLEATRAEYAAQNYQASMRLSALEASLETHRKEHPTGDDLVQMLEERTRADAKNQARAIAVDASDDPRIRDALEAGLSRAYEKGSARPMPEVASKPAEAPTVAPLRPGLFQRFFRG